MEDMAARVMFYGVDYIPEEGLTYSVIPARYRRRWIFVRHYDSDGWELAAGHIEKGESAENAAGRELTEETGAREFMLYPVATYSVEDNGVKDYGQLFFAEVTEMSDHTDIAEISEVIICDWLPEDMTYPDIQPVLFRKVIGYIREKSLF